MLVLRPECRVVFGCCGVDQAIGGGEFVIERSIDRSRNYASGNLYENSALKQTLYLLRECLSKQLARALRNFKINKRRNDQCRGIPQHQCKRVFVGSVCKNFQPA